MAIKRGGTTGGGRMPALCIYMQIQQSAVKDEDAKVLGSESKQAP